MARGRSRRPLRRRAESTSPTASSISRRADQVGRNRRHGISPGRTDLLLIAVDAAALGAALKYEVSRGGALFPHLYAPLPLAAVHWAKPLPLGADGRHVFPAMEA